VPRVVDIQVEAAGMSIPLTVGHMEVGTEVVKRVGLHLKGEKFQVEAEADEEAI